MAYPIGRDGEIPVRAGSPFSNQKGESRETGAPAGSQRGRPLNLVSPPRNPTDCDHRGTSRVYEYLEFPRCGNCDRSIFPYRMRSDA